MFFLTVACNEMERIHIAKEKDFAPAYFISAYRAIYDDGVFGNLKLGLMLDLR